MLDGANAGPAPSKVVTHVVLRDPALSERVTEAPRLIAASRDDVRVDRRSLWTCFALSRCIAIACRVALKCGP